MRLLLGAALVVLVAIGAAGLYARNAVYGDRSLPAAETSVVIARGATAAEVAEQLAAQRVIRSALAFELLARVRHEQGNVNAGEYRFAPHRTLDEVLRSVTTGGAQVAVWVTIPEGFTAREIAATLEEHSLGEASAYEEYFLHTPLDLGAAGRTRNLEGFLFPDTYLLPVDATPATVARILTTHFREVLPHDALKQARRFHLSVPQVVTLASLVEREAKADGERPLMAGVYYNRLRRHMPLEVDATIEYTFAHHKDVITRADLARDSPYNTYTRLGLPPTPIANPGRPSLVAAFRPQPSQFLYYVYMGNGHHAFSRTLAEQNANVARYLH